MRIFPVIIGMLLAVPAFGQSPGTVSLIGPSTTPGAPQVTRVAQINEAVNAALVVKVDTVNGILTNPTIGGNATINTTSATGYQWNGSTILKAYGNSGNMFSNGPGTVTLVGLGAGANLPAADYLTTAVGWHAMNANTSANTESTAVGWASQGKLVDGNQNTTLGINTLGTCASGCVHDIQIGTDSMRNGTGSYNVGIGVNTLINDDAGSNIAIGDATYQSNLTATGTLNLAIGWQTFQAISLTSGQKNVAIGNTIANGCTTCSNNIFIGNSAGAATVTGIQSVYVGSQSGLAVNGNGVNTWLGNNAGKSATTAQQSTLIGANVGQTTFGTGQGVILIGSGKQAVDTPAGSTSNWLNIENTYLAQTVAPTIASGFGTSPTIPLGTSSAAFQVNVGTGGTASTGVILIANAAPHGWACNATDITTPASFVTVATPLTTTSITLTNYSRTSGLLTAWTASDVVNVTCNGY